MRSPLQEALKELRTRDALERAVALVVTKLLPSDSTLLLDVSNPNVGELMLTSKQAETYSKARAILLKQRE